MNSTELLNEIKNQLELLKHKGYDKNSFKSGYLLGYAKALQLQQTGVMVRSFREYFEKEVVDDFDNGFNKYQTLTERNLTIMQLIDRYNKKYNNQCEHYFPTYLKNQKRNYKPCEFCGTIRQNEP